MRLTRAKIIAIVHRTLRELELDEPPIDGFEFAKRLGIEVRKKNYLDPRILAILFKGEERSSIFLNEYAPERWQFSLFHETSHFLLHPLGSYMDTLDMVEDVIERQANLAAAEAMMPQHWVKRLGPVYRWDPELLADRFGASVQAMRIRLKELGLPVLY